MNMASNALSLLSVHPDDSISEHRSSGFLRDLPSSSNFLLYRQSSSSKTKSCYIGNNIDGDESLHKIFPSDISNGKSIERLSFDEVDSRSTLTNRAIDMQAFQGNNIGQKLIISNKEIGSFSSGGHESMKLQITHVSKEKCPPTSDQESLFSIQSEKTTKTIDTVGDCNQTNASNRSHHNVCNQSTSESETFLMNQPQNHQFFPSNAHENLQIVVHSSCEDKKETPKPALNRSCASITHARSQIFKHRASAMVSSAFGQKVVTKETYVSEEALQPHMIPSANMLRKKMSPYDAKKERLHTPRVLPSVGAFAIQCAACMKWRLAPSKEHYERIRESILERPFYCSSGKAWNPEASCDDPSELSDDPKYLWAIDKPNIPVAPDGWQRLLVIRGAGASKFADIYYMAPNGKKLRSMPEIERFLAENPHYVMNGGVSPNQFSFVIPKSLDKNYCRKRTNVVSNANASNHMRGSINNSQQKKLLRNSLGQRCEPLLSCGSSRYGEAAKSSRSIVPVQEKLVSEDIEQRYSIVPYSPQPLWSSADGGIKYLC